MRVLINERVAVGETGTREDADWLICSAAADVVTIVGGETGCILAVDGNGTPEDVDGIVNDVGLEVDGIASETLTTIND